MATPPEEEKEGGKEPGKRTYISALLSSRAPPQPAQVDQRGLLGRIDAKTGPLRTPYSANVSRKDASILAALAPPGQEKARLGRRTDLAPPREASNRKGFEVLEWEREREMLTADELAEAAEQVMAGSEAARAGEAPSMEMEQSPLVAEEELAEAPAPAREAPPPATPPPPPKPAEAGEVVVGMRPGHRPREGGQFPGELMESMEEAAAEGSPVIARKERAAPPPPPPAGIVSYERGFSEGDEEPPQETVTREELQGAAPRPHSQRWPSETGLELHIDGFEDMARQSDICPRCGRRITVRNRLLSCSDCGVVACESCEIRTTAHVESPFFYDWKFTLPLCIRCFEKAFGIQKSLSKAKTSLGMGNFTYAYYHAQQALKADPASAYADEARDIVAQIDRRRRESAEQDKAWKKQLAAYSRTTVVHEK